MPEVNCNVNNCSHNKDAICFANSVNVAGGRAKESDNTCCASFLNGDNYGTLTSNTNDYGSQCMDVVCNVQSCSYYNNKYCTADSINVSGGRANIYEETNCSTFKKE